jgi:hypothetical protein
MTTRLYSSTSQETTLTSALNSSAATMVVASPTGILAGKIPANTSPLETFTVVIDPDTALEEIVDVIYPSSPSSATLTIVRGRDGSSPIAHSAGAKVRHMAIGRDLTEANQHIENTTTAHGLTLANVVKTTDTGVVTSTMITDGTIATGDIADSAITTAKIADSAITSAKIADLGIATGDIADSAITSGKIATGAVGTVKIDDLAVTNAKLAGSIAPSKITGTAVTQADTGTVTSTMIANGTIVDADINSAAAIDKTKISGTAITAADTGTVTSTMIADATIVNTDISATAAIAKTKLDLGGTITSADLVDGTIVAADIADGAITAAKMAVDPYARANHTGTQAASTISNFDTAVRTNRLDQMATPTTSVAMGSQKITGLADPTSAQDAVTVNYITGQKGAVNGLASLDSSGLIPQSQIPSIALHTTTVVNSQAAMLAINGADAGDIAVRTDINKTFVLTASPASTLANWQELLTPTDSVLSVDGNTGAITLSGTYLAKAGGTMSGALAMGNNKITGLGTPTATGDAATKDYVDAVAGSATAAAASAAAAATTYDNFDDRYLGAKSTPPTLDNDGNALITGAIYWDTTAAAMYAWSGSAWASISSTAAIYRYKYVATGGETTVSGADSNGLTLSYIVGKEQVYLNGILLVRTTDYNASSGTSITSLAALAAGDILEIITFTAFDLATAIQQSLFTAKGDVLVGTSAGVAGKIAVGANNTVLVADSSTATGLKWSAYDPLPSQTGNTGKYLTTDGSSASWGTLSAISTAKVYFMKG